MAQNGNGTQTKLLVAVLASLLGIGGMQGIAQFKGDPDAVGRQVEAMDEILGRVDSNGVPLVYVPRELVETQKEILKTLREIKEELRTR